LRRRRNVHLLGNSRTAANGSTATGEWIMQHLSDYDGGGTELIWARLRVDFEYAEGAARICHLRKRDPDFPAEFRPPAAHLSTASALGKPATLRP